MGGGCGGGKAPQGGKPGDWICPNCGDLVFASRNACKMCGTQKVGGNPNSRPGDWTCPKCGDNVFASKIACRCGVTKAEAMAGGMQISNGNGGRPGDWNCDSCGNMNFSSRQTCKQCDLPRPEGAKRLGMKPGDWICPSCADVVFASKDACKMCGTGKPDGAGISEAQATWTGGKGGGGNSSNARPGDWNCTSCGNMNFSSRTDCKSCSAPRPEGQMRLGMKPGDWICGGCGDLVFSSRNACKMCGMEKTADSVTCPKGAGRAAPYNF